MIDKRLMKLLGDSKRHIAANVICQWLLMICNVIFIGAVVRIIGRLRSIPDAQSDIITSATKKPFMGTAITHGELMITAAVCVCMIILKNYFNRKASYCSYQASKDVKISLRSKIYEKLTQIGPSYSEKVPTSELVQVSMEGVEQLEIYFGKYLPQLFYSVLAPLTLFIIVSFIDFKTAFILFLCVPLIPVSIVAVQKFAKKLLAKYWNTYTGLGDSFLENLQGLTTLKIYSADEAKSKQMDEEAEKFRKITMRVLIMQLNSISVMDLVAYGGAALGIIIALLQYRAQSISLTQMLFIILVSSEFFIPMRLLGSFFHIAMNGMAAGNKIFKILNLEVDANRTESIDHIESITFDNVGYSYDEKRQVLDCISLSIHQHESVALAGVSGCGKSTIAGILSGKNTTYTGSVKINGIELLNIEKESLSRNITYVGHNGYLFGGTIEENLRMAKPEVSEEEMIAVLKQVCLYDFLCQEQGLNTVLLEQGANLSGGQRQRLAIARALLYDTPVYIFDEATSNIDVESEEIIMDLIESMKHNKTILIISHRLENIIKTDRIYMLSSGQIKESGTHNELLRANREYAKMYQTQHTLESIRSNGQTENDHGQTENDHGQAAKAKLNRNEGEAYA